MKLLPLLIAILFPAHPLVADGPSVDDQLSKFLAESSKSRAACEKFDKDAGKLVTSQNGKYKTGQPKELLRLVESYPGVPAGEIEASQLILDANEKGQAFNIEMADKIHVCRPLTLCEADQALMNAVREGSLPSELSAKVKDHVINDVRSHFGPMLMDQLIRVRLLLELQESKLVDLGANLEKVEATKKEGDAVRKQLEAMSGGKKPTPDSRRRSMILGLKATTKLRQELDQVCKSL